MALSIALFQPDIPGNTGAILRLAACCAIDVHIIEPAGFDLSDRNLRRAGMDYLDLAHLTRHIDWAHFISFVQEHQKRLVLFTTQATQSYYDFSYHADDILLFGRESAGCPPFVHRAAAAQLRIPIAPRCRSLNLALSVAMATSQALAKPLKTY